MNHDDSTTYRGSLPKNAAALSTWHDTGPGEAALEPALPIVDPHHHLFGETTDAQYYRRSDLEGDLAGGHRIVGTVYVEAYSSGWRTSGPEHLRPVGEVEIIASQVAGPANTAHGHCEVAAGIVAHADLTLGQGVNEVLEAQLDAAQGRLRGIRQVAAHDDGLVGHFIQHLPKRHLLADTGFRAGLAQLHRHGLSFDVWIYHHQMRELIELVDCFPQTTFILDHVGGLIGVGEFRSQREAVFASWREDLGRLAARPNVYVKIGGMGMPVSGFGFEHRTRPPTSGELAQAWLPLIEVVLDAFGTKRCMFESNFPVDRQSCGYTELWNAFKLATRCLSPDERSDVFHRTACLAYRLKLNT
jgi:predicted TIM-barrel fold metal-dependent hydrolase